MIYFVKTNLTTSFFSKILVEFLSNSIIYVVSRSVSSALSDAIKVTLLRTVLFKAYSQMILPNEAENEYAALKLMG